MPDDLLDPFDPRREAPGLEQDDVDRLRTLVAGAGPGPSHRSPQARILRVAVPLVAIVGLGVIVWVFLSGLNPGSSSMAVGPVDQVRAAIADAPRRVCLRGASPCAWLTVVDDAIVAFNTNGPLPQEFGRLGVSWCPSSGYFGANATGSRWDHAGLLVEGPATRGLDRFTLDADSGVLVIRFASLSAGRAGFQTDPADIRPRDGAACEEIPFYRDADLVLPDAEES